MIVGNNECVLRTALAAIYKCPRRRVGKSARDGVGSASAKTVVRRKKCARRRGKRVGEDGGSSEKLQTKRRLDKAERRKASSNMMAKVMS